MKTSITIFCVVVALSMATVANAQNEAVKDYPSGTSVRILSPAPKPGVHPRIFFSPEDLPALREAATKSPARQIYYNQLKKNVAEQLDAPQTPEGKVMATIASGAKPTENQFAATNKMSDLLWLASIDCIIQNDRVRGEKLASALSAWATYQLGHWVRKPDPVGLSNSFDTDFCLAYDFIAPWMKEEQCVPVRKFIAKMIDGIHIYTWDMPARWRMWNWAGLHVFQGYGSLAIEGEKGYDPLLWNEAKMIARDFLNYNIHPSGSLTEDLTYFTLGFEGTGLVAVAMAKRGEQDVWENTNLSKLKYHLLAQLNPWGKGFVSHADGQGDGFYSSFAIWKFMYPKDPLIDFTWRSRVGENYEIGGPGNDATMRTWVVTLFGTEHFPEKVNASDLKQPLTYFCPERGYMVARTGWDDNALKLDFEAKQDYPIAGHNHADANNFTLSALGREWVVEAGYHQASGNLHNEVMVDGMSQSPWPMPGGRWIDMINTPDVVIGVSDAEHAYNYHWSDTGWSPDNNPPSNKEKWEKEIDPNVLPFYAGTENRLTRTGIFDHYSPFLLRSVWNPVEKAFRTASLVRGIHPYVFIVDDMRKDDQIHLYEWLQQMPEDVEVIRTGGDWMVIGNKNQPINPKDKNAKQMPDNRRLLVQIVDVDAGLRTNAMSMRLESFVCAPGIAYENGKICKRLTIPALAVDPRYKVLLYPFTEGAEMPSILWNDEHTQCSIIWHDQEDHYTFAKGEGGRTVYRLDRSNKTLAIIQAAPQSPVLRTSDRIFADSCTVEFFYPQPGQEIHYTLDGSAPTAKSPFYDRPFAISKSAKLKAITFARKWDFGQNAVSNVVDASFTKQQPLEALKNPQIKPGLHASIYEGFWNILPNFSKEKAKFETTVDHFVLPTETPAIGFGLCLNGLVNAPSSGVYTFSLKCDDAGKLWIDDQLVVDNDGAHVIQTRTGQVALSQGWHRIKVENCDNALPLGKGKGDGSWAFEVLWAQPFGGLNELPARMLAQEVSSVVKTKPVPTIPAVFGLITETGLVYTSYDRSAQYGTAQFFDISGVNPYETGYAPSIETSTSSEKLLNVYSGFIQVPFAGVYQFALSPNAHCEMTLGYTVVARVSPVAGNLAGSFRLEAGTIPIVVKLANGSGLIQWKGPGMDWQNIESANWVRKVEKTAQAQTSDLNTALVALWRTSTLTENKIPNLIKNAAPDFSFLEALAVVNDPQRGKVLKLNQNKKIIIDNFHFLKNELSLVFWIKPSANKGKLAHYGYGFTGFTFNLTDNGGVHGAGEKNSNVTSTLGNLLDPNQWHQIVATIGGRPVRSMSIYVDGRLQSSAKTEAPCLVPNMEFFDGYNGLVSEIRIYNRTLVKEEVSVLYGNGQ